MNNQQDDDYENDNLNFLPADHPLLQRLQGALTKQLTDEHERVDLQLIENEEKLKKIERQKEDVGVQLYGVQQQLAENQMTFEQTHENYNLVQKLRIEVEQKLGSLNENYLSKKREVEELRKKYIKAQDEHSKLKRTLKEISDYNVQMKSAIAVTRTGTLRAEENVVGLEKQKRKQDFLIDQMNEEIKRLTEQKTILTAQLISQKEETEQAQQILKEAQIEMQKIIQNKKNLLERWQKSIFMMQQRDFALQAIKDALNQQQEQNIQLGTELIGINNEINKEADTMDNLASNNHKLENERKHLEQEKKKLEHNLSKLDAQITLLTKSLQTTEGETKKVDLDQKSIDEQMTSIEQTIMKLHTETKKLHEQIINNISEHKTIEKTAANLHKQANLIAIEIEEKQVEFEDLQNEISRVQIDKLNTQAQIEVLENKKKDVIKEKEGKEMLVAKFEIYIRQGHDLNEKKQHEVGRLNKQHDELMSSTSDVNRGPLEAQINNLNKQIEEKKKQIDLNKREWIKKQTDLVNKSNQLEDVDHETSQLKTKQTILQQKKLRLNNNYLLHQKEIKEIQNSLKNLQTEMNRLNDKLALNNQARNELTNENFNLESEFIEKLKEMEKESVKFELQIDQLREEKADLLSEIVEAERQILLWERKIQLEKEMQETLNPDYGQKENQELKKDIHRMELRLEDLRKRQESVIIEMERSVYKRETIQLKYINKGSKDNNQNQNAPVQIKKQISSLKNTLNTTTTNAKQIEAGIRKKMSDLQKIKEQHDDTDEKNLYLERSVHEAEQEFQQTRLNIQLNKFKIKALQIQYKSFEDIATKKSKLSYPENILRQKLQDIGSQNDSIKEAILKLKNEQPRFNFLLDPLLDL